MNATIKRKQRTRRNAVRVNKKGAKSKDSDVPSQGFRRIVPGEGAYPTLVSTKAIVTSDLDVNDYPDYDGDSVSGQVRAV